MNEEPPTHRRGRRVFATISVLTGIALAGMVIIPQFWKFFTEDSDGYDLLFLLITIPFMSIPGTILVLYGSRLFKEDSETSLRYVVGTLVFLVSLILIVRLAPLFEAFFPELATYGFGQLAFAFLVTFAYPLMVSRLIPLVGIERRKASAFVTKGFLIALAWLFWLGLNEIFKETGIDKLLEDSTRIPTLGAMIFFLPAIIAYICYAIARAVFVKPAEPRKFTMDFTKDH